jgi:competence protein ComEC
LLAALSAGTVIRSPFCNELQRSVTEPRVRLVAGVVVRGCTLRDQQRSCVIEEADGALLQLSAGVSCAARPGDSLEIVATVTQLYPTINEGLVGPNAALLRRNIFAQARGEQCVIVGQTLRPWLWIRRGAFWLRHWLEQGIDCSFSPTQAARARSLLFGDDDGVSEVELDEFRRSGLSHLLAVSGAHVALLAVVLQWLARAVCNRSAPVLALGLREPLAQVLPLPVLIAFVLATGEAPSAIRALVMALLSAAAVLAGRKPHPPSVLAASVLITLALEPNWRFDVGWQLSITASWALLTARNGDGQIEQDTLALNQLSGRYTRALWGGLRAALKSLRVALVATARVALLTLPICAAMAGQVPVGALLANLVAAPLAEAVLLPGVLATSMLGHVSVTAGAALAWCVSWGLRVLFVIPSWALRVPLASVAVAPPTDGQQFVWLTVVGLGLFMGRKTLGVCVSIACALVAVLELRHRAFCHPRDVLRLTVIDVGQGDALLLDLPDGSAMLIDAGGVMRGADPGQRVVVPFLARRRRRELLAVVASHAHPDHVNGLPAVFRFAQVHALWDSRQSEIEPNLQHWRAVRDSSRIAVRGPESLCGSASLLPQSGAQVRVLAPCPAAISGTPPNDASMVLRVDYGRGSLLLPGDLERDGEQLLLPALTPVTVLKLGHHGSRTSTTAPWLAALSPRVAVVSAGHPSPFAHPHREVRERLARLGIALWDTPTFGCLRITVRNDGTFEVDTDESP